MLEFQRHRTRSSDRACRKARALPLTASVKMRGLPCQPVRS